MLQLMKIHRLISLRNQYNKAKAEALRFMKTGDLKNYFAKLTEASRLKKEFSETVSMEI